MKTTFQRIKYYGPCENGWKTLIGYYKPKSLKKEITIEEIVKSNGIKDAVWALRAVENKKTTILFCADIAESVLPIFENKYPNDDRIRKCIEGIRLFANNEISKDKLRKLQKAAYTAAAYTDAADAANAAADAANAAADAVVAVVANAADAADAAYAAADAAADAVVANAAYAAAWNNFKKLLEKYY
ncbi:MAG: hypothetical protein PQJ44_08625 [Sphaerochaetaceae bacterium]|nr:hypothetical protein [Sphaerochaetaceae bacterium]